MKLVKWLNTNILLVLTLFLLAFIPLYPKIPLIDIAKTWVYIRVDDLVIAVSLLIFGIQWLRNRATLKTPLTVPIFLFWTIGAISTLSAVLFIFPQLANVYPNIALLHYLRRIEYLAPFFLAYSAMRDKKFVKPVVITLLLTLVAVVVYGLGQRFLGFPAFLTMNEEFAKGIPLRLSPLARIPSTFAGHYDLAAYLVMLIPILGSMFFGVKNIWMRLSMLLAAFGGLILLFMTASRTSFLVYLVTIAFMLILQKKKWVIIPVFIISFVLLQSFQGLSQRFASTISGADVVYDARTNQPIGIAKEVNENGKKKLVIQDIQSTGENLPQGSSYINFPSQQGKNANSVTYKRSKIQDGLQSVEIRNLDGDFIVRKSLALDVSYTTRIQGGWPRAIEAFKRNIFLGSGYSSIDLATDGNYLRILGEVGILGFISYGLIFVFISIYSAKVLPHIESTFVRSFIYGITAAIFGLSLNAILIDVFEASKVAYTLWLLVGVGVGTLALYQKEKIQYLFEIKRIFTSIPALMIYLLVAGFFIFAKTANTFFIGDDYTWLRWVADCQKVPGTTECLGVQEVFINYFTQSQNFFYRPGTKMYFYFMYAISWFSPLFYHVVSILLHALVTLIVLILASKILRSRLFGFITAVFFLVLASHYESIFWISSTGQLIGAFLMLGSLLSFIFWKERKNWLFFALALLFALGAPLFHEFGAFVPVLLIGYDLIISPTKISNILKRWYYLVFLAIIPGYATLRIISGSVWFHGDYSYNLVKLPFNIIGNILGYLSLSFFGPSAMPVYESLRNQGKSNILVFGLIIIVLAAVLGYGLWKMFVRLGDEDRKTVAISLLLFIVPLLPFLGLGNITDRYLYIASVGALLLFVFILQKIFSSLYVKQRILSYLLLLLIVLPFTAFHVSELNRINDDWVNAGSITSNLLVSLGNNYKSSKQQLLPPNPILYFVNVPIRYGNAWVFPVGLDDAIWFVFQTEGVKVVQIPTLDEAIQKARGDMRAKVFLFNKEGDFEEILVNQKKL